MAGGLPPGDETIWLGEWGEDWFRTICTTAGCPTGRPRPDVVGTDFTVHDHWYESVRFQVKTTEHPTRVDRGFAFDLDIQTYDRLRRGSTRGYLALVVVHEVHPRWTGHVQRGSIVRATVYWAELSGLAPTQNRETVRVSLPLSNMLTPASLLKLFPEGGDDVGSG